MNQIKALLAVFLGSLLISTQAHAYMINDAEFGANTYWGAKNQGTYGDVIGSSGLFDILGIDVSQTGSILTVDIFTNFAGRGDDSLYTGLTKRTASGYDESDPDNPANVSNGIGYGDLFLASAWTPEGSDAHNTLDDNVTGTKWEYGLALDNRWWDGVSAGGGSAILYSLNGASNDANALLSDDFLSGGTFRNGQEVAVDTAATDPQDPQSPLNTVVDANGSWTVDAANKKISFMFDIGETGLLDNGELALHWAMTCGNDTIEGSWDVPEPSTLSLIGLSLLGIGFIGRRKRIS